jgi:hypothetical protein
MFSCAGLPSAHQDLDMRAAGEGRALGGHGQMLRHRSSAQVIRFFFISFHIQKTFIRTS